MNVAPNNTQFGHNTMNSHSKQNMSAPLCSYFLWGEKLGCRIGVNGIKIFNCKIICNQNSISGTPGIVSGIHPISLCDYINVKH